MTTPDPNSSSHRSVYRRWLGRAGLVVVVVVVSAVATAAIASLAIDMAVRLF